MHRSEEELFLEVTLIGGRAGGPLGAVFWTNLLISRASSFGLQNQAFLILLKDHIVCGCVKAVVWYLPSQIYIPSLSVGKY